MAKELKDETEQGNEVKIKHLKEKPSKLRKIVVPERDIKLESPESGQNLSTR
jgi:hypothetical protein